MLYYGRIRNMIRRKRRIVKHYRRHLGCGEQKGQTRIAKGDEGKYIHVPAEMTYEDFRAVYVEKTQTVDEWKETNGLGDFEMILL